MYFILIFISKKLSLRKKFTACGSQIRHFVTVDFMELKSKSVGSFYPVS